MSEPKDSYATNEEVVKAMTDLGRKIGVIADLAKIAPQIFESLVVNNKSVTLSMIAGHEGIQVVENE